ncbi:MAG: hypothetical protein OER04_07395 [Cyclobacteriaceae bacterium]|nr:hypothetical protein [Cyclobacteriaceae bacterium]
MDNRILFICTGNYYRSRYAEILFNNYAQKYDLNWRAFSRGFQESTRPWPISPNAKHGLAAKGITLDQTRYPMKLDPKDLSDAYHVILMDEIEHRPMMTEEYPEWLSRVDFWQIRDIDFESPHSALAKLDIRLQRLMADLNIKHATA